MENESISVSVCSMCFHDHSSKCDKLVTAGIQCTCPMDEKLVSSSFQTKFNETYEILVRLNECAKIALTQVAYVECEHKSDQVKQAKDWVSRIYTLSKLFNSLVTPDLGDEHSPRNKE